MTIAYSFPSEELDPSEVGGRWMVNGEWLALLALALPLALRSRWR